MIYSFSLLPDLLKFKLGESHIRLSLFFFIPIALHALWNLKEIFLILPKKLLWILGSYLIWNLILVLLGFSFRSAGFFVWLVLNFLFLFNFLLKELSFVKYVTFLKYSMLGNSFYIVFQALYFKWTQIVPIAGDPRFYFINETDFILRSFGFFQEPSYLALGVSGLLAIEFWQRSSHTLLEYFFLFIITLATTLSYSRLSFLVLIFILIGLVIISLRNKKIEFKKFGIIFFAIIISFLNAPTYFVKSSISNKVVPDVATVAATKNAPIMVGSFQDRASSFKQSIELAMNKWIIGGGIGNSKRDIGQLYNGENIKNEGVHNLYLEMIAEQGFIGVILFFTFLFFLGRHFKVSLNQSIPIYFILIIPMMFCQNVNSPALWLFLPLLLRKVNYE